MCLTVIYIMMDVLFTLHVNGGYFQDHIVEWSDKNPVFLDKTNRLRVREGDNIIFVCSEANVPNIQLFWTMKAETFESCAPHHTSEMVKLLECQNSNVPKLEFILKVARFSEMQYTPTFEEGHLVYFLSQQEICLRANMRLIVEVINVENLTPDYNNSHIVSTTANDIKQNADIMKFNDQDAKMPRCSLWLLASPEQQADFD
ncbi:unnamed protein product [Dicrocoelium dendriticum]|nr:unnamed protein product [Dicrocoelium dendriticum]